MGTCPSQKFAYGVDIIVLFRQVSPEERIQFLNHLEKCDLCKSLLEEEFEDYRNGRDDYNCLPRGIESAKRFLIAVAVDNAATQRLWAVIRNNLEDDPDSEHTLCKFASALIRIITQESIKPPLFLIQRELESVARRVSKTETLLGGEDAFAMYYNVRPAQLLLSLRNIFLKEGHLFVIKDDTEQPRPSKVIAQCQLCGRELELPNDGSPLLNAYHLTENEGCPQ